MQEEVKSDFRKEFIFAFEFIPFFLLLATSQDSSVFGNCCVGTDLVIDLEMRLILIFLVFEVFVY